MLDNIVIFIIVAVAALLLGTLMMILKWYQKSEQGQALVKTGWGGTKVSFSGMFVIPVLQRLEIMDISLKTIVISRLGKDGLICKDNLRADIKVTFFVRVNKTHEDVIQVGQSIGCKRASDRIALEELFDAKFAEALKTVGKKFDFVELYNSRDQFKEGILQIIGTDLNGYILDDCAIDYLEQTALESLNERNILDAEGIKKITELTATQKILANQIDRDREKTIKQQDVLAREAILEMEKQLAETEEKQKREIATIKSREEAEAAVVMEQERLKSVKARIVREEETQVAEENRDRQVIVARKNKERIEAIETERVDKDRLLEQTEKDRVVTLAGIAKEKAVEEERKNIQEVIRERVAVEKTVVEEEQRIKDTEAFATAEREKQVTITLAEMRAQEALVQEVKTAEAQRQSAEFKAKQLLIEAEAEQATAGKRAEAMKVLAEAEIVQKAAAGVAEAQVMEAKAAAMEKQGIADASVIKNKAIAEAASIDAVSAAQAQADKKLGLVAAEVAKEKGLAEANVIEATAMAEEQKGLKEANVMVEKLSAEAKGVEAKAEAMRKLDGVGKDHEEFKLTLQKQKEVELASIHIQKDIAEAQASVLGEALKSAKIDIVGGETMFFDKITQSITQGKSIERLLHNSPALTDVKNTFFNPNDETHSFKENFSNLVNQFGISAEDLKNLSLTALILKMTTLTDNSETKGLLDQMLNLAERNGLSNRSADSLGIRQIVA
jgi:uncharacterized membrane protein YqiK